jgi:hypothetical protein
MTNEMKQCLLSKIAGLTQATWYSLDRAMSRDGYAGINVLEAVDELIKLGLVEQCPGKDPALPFYKLTEMGTAQLC